MTARRLPPLLFLALLAGHAANVAVRAAARDPFAAPPYAGFILATSATIVRNAPEPVRIETLSVDGPMASAPQNSPGVARRHAIRLVGLTPATTYQWNLSERVEKTGEVRHFDGRFRTAPLEGPVKFALLGDGGKSRVGRPWQTPGRQGEVAAKVLDWRPDLVLYVGDIVYPDGRAEEYPEAFFRPFRGVLDAGIPVFPAIGNHDAKQEYCDTYFAAFPVPREGPGGGYYYSFDWGEVHFAVLDTSTRRLQYDPAQIAWLERDLDASKKPWRIALAHHPPYQDHEETQLDRVLPPILAQHGAAAYLNGHYHVYERIEPGDGVLYLTSGGGGDSIHERRSESPHSKLLVPRYHYVRATADAKRLVFEAVALEGDVFDRVELTRP